MTDEATGLHNFCGETVLEESAGCDELNGAVVIFVAREEPMVLFEDSW